MGLISFNRPRSPLRFAITVFLLLAGAACAPCQEPAAPVKKAAKKPPAEKSRYWTTQWAFDDVDVGKLTRRLGTIGIDTGLDLEGKVSVKFEVGIPTASLRDAAAYRFDGLMTSPSLVVEGAQLKNFRTTINYRDGVATLKNLKSQLIDTESKRVGEIEGSGLAELVPRGEATADVRFQKISIAPIADILAKFNVAKSAGPITQSGDLSGDVKFTVPLESANNIATYQLKGEFSGSGLKVGGLPPANFETKQLTIQDEILNVDSFLLTTAASERSGNSIRLKGNALVPLSGTGKFEFGIDGDDVPLGIISELIEQTKIDGKVDFRLKGTGKIADQIETTDWKIEGAISSPKLRVAGVNLGRLEHDIAWTPTEFSIAAKRDLADLPKSFQLGRIRCQYTVDSKSLAINRLDAALFGGQIQGSAKIPLDSNGTVLADLEIADLRPTLPLTDNGVIGDLSTTISGKIDWRFPIKAIDQPSAHQGVANLKLVEISLGGQPVGELDTTASADSGELKLRSTGTLFDGTVTVDTAASVQSSDRWSDVTMRLDKTVFNFDAINLTRLFTTVQKTRTDLTGTVSGQVTIVDFNQASDSQTQFPDTDIDVVLNAVRHRSRLLTRSLRLRGKLQSNVFSINSLVGDYAGGTARARGQVYLVNSSGHLHPRADLRISASHIDLQRGLWFLGDTAENYEGLASMTATLTGTDDLIRMRGNVEGHELAFYGLSLGIAHSGLVADADINHSQWNVRFPSVKSRQGGGQVQGELSISSSRRGGSGIDLASRWSTSRVDFGRLAKQYGQSNSLAHGNITGDLTVGGKSVQTIDDLSGRFKFRLGQTRGAGIPGLVGISRFLGPVSLVSQTFDVGEAKGLIGRGVVVVDEFWLGSDSTLIQADGKVFLRSGRLDLNTLIATGDYRDIAVNFTELAQRYALQSLIPTSAILNLSQLLRDRTLVVRVMGRINSPIIRIQPVETFREEAARFLLREGQRVIVAGITAGAVDGIGSN